VAPFWLGIAVGAQVPRLQPFSSAFASARRQEFASPGCQGQPALDPVPRLLARANSGSGIREYRRVSFDERRGFSMPPKSARQPMEAIHPYAGRLTLRERRANQIFDLPRRQTF
jgi:hypothetical protein